MITCLIGTRAQLIKMAPVIVEMERRTLPINLLFTGQHKQTMQELLDNFSIRTRQKYIYNGPEITGIAQTGVWFITCLWRMWRNRDSYLSKSKGDANAILVHGDTLSTLIGAIVGRLTGMTVAHVEAGLRSYNIFHPFPEELTRLAVFQLSHIAFCPGEWACKNIDRYKLQRVNTTHNTLRDAVVMALKTPVNLDQEMIADKYGVCSIHRFENIFYKRRLLKIISLIERAAEKYRIIFVLHPSIRKKLESNNLVARLENNPDITLLPRMGYINFIHLLSGALFVITDGGSNQEELSYMGVPTLLMRKATERQEGLGSTAFLANYKRQVMDDFLSHLEDKRTGNPLANNVYPSKLIVDHIERYA